MPNKTNKPPVEGWEERFDKFLGEVIPKEQWGIFKYEFIKSFISQELQAKDKHYEDVIRQMIGEEKKISKEWPIHDKEYRLYTIEEASEERGNNLKRQEIIKIAKSHNININ